MNLGIASRVFDGGSGRPKGDWESKSNRFYCRRVQKLKHIFDAEGAENFVEVKNFYKIT